jgi:hypothetical protein
MAKSARSFTYQKRTKEMVKERANMRGGGFDDFIQSKYKKYKVRDGKNIIRILPPTWEGATHYGYDIYVNYGIGPDNGAYLSLSKHKKGADPIADAHREASRDGDEELARKLSARQRILMWVIDRQDEDEGPVLWAAPFTVDKAFCNLARDEDTGEVVFVDDPDKGCDIRFYKEGQGLKTDYDASRMKLMDPGPVSDDDKQVEEWLEYIQQNPLPDTLRFYDADYISEIFNGKPAKKQVEDDEDEKLVAKKRVTVDDDEADTPRRVRPKAKPAEDEDEETEEVDEAPAKKEGSIRERIAARRKAATAEAEDDDE